MGLLMTFGRVDMVWYRRKFEPRFGGKMGRTGNESLKLVSVWEEEERKAGKSNGGVWLHLKQGFHRGENVKG